MCQHFNEVRAIAGAHYTPEIHGQLCRKLNKAKPSKNLYQKMPEIAQILKTLGQSLSTLAAALKWIDRNEFLQIDFSSIATFAQEVEREGYNCYKATREAESLLEAKRAKAAEAKKNNRSIGELSIRVSLGLRLCSDCTFLSAIAISFLVR
jgi:hypothetical protein